MSQGPFLLLRVILFGADRQEGSGDLQLTMIRTSNSARDIEDSRLSTEFGGALIVGPSVKGEPCYALSRSSTRDLY
jgi:hypothetical protein